MTTTPPPALPPLREDQIRRYARHVLVPDIGGVGQRRLLAAAVVVPIGGADTAAALAAIAYLVGAGVGQIALAGDPGGAVTAADARAGVVLGPADEGLARVDAIAAWARAHNPDVRVVAAGPGHAGAPRFAIAPPPSDAHADPGAPWTALGVSAPSAAAASLVAGGAAAVAMIAAIIRVVPSAAAGSSDDRDDRDDPDATPAGAVPRVPKGSP